MELLAQTEMLSRRQVMLLPHHLTIRVNYRLFSTLGSPYPKFPGEWLFFYLFCLRLPQLRATSNRYVADAIYSRAKGAQLRNVPAFGGEVYIVDCTAEINVTFKIGGQSYPIHPLDVTQQDVDSNGVPFCFGTVRVASPQIPAC